MSDTVEKVFFGATQEVLGLMLDLDHISEEALSAEVFEPKGNLNIAIGVTGDLQGRVIYRIPKETSLEMVRIMSGMEIEEVDEFVSSAIGEIANIISGKALVELSERQITCDILPPEILKGDRLLSESGQNAFATSIHTEIGDMELNINLRTD